MKLQQFQLTESQLKNWGIRITQLRKSYRAYAESVLKKSCSSQRIDEVEMKRAIMKVRARGAVRKEGMTME